jgi:hypothetical protein
MPDRNPTIPVKFAKFDLKTFSEIRGIFLNSSLFRHGWSRVKKESICDHQIFLLSTFISKYTVKKGY